MKMSPTQLMYKAERHRVIDVLDGLLRDRRD
jgi:hypothetical protein